MHCNLPFITGLDRNKYVMSNLLAHEIFFKNDATNSSLLCKTTYDMINTELSLSFFFIQVVNKRLLATTFCEQLYINHSIAHGQPVAFIHRYCDRRPLLEEVS